VSFRVADDSNEQHHNQNYRNCEPGVFEFNVARRAAVMENLGLQRGTDI